MRYLIPYRLRWLHHWWADLTGYFWLPCPLCGQPFGGHEAHVPGDWGKKLYCTGCHRARKKRHKTQMYLDTSMRPIEK